MNVDDLGEFGLIERLRGILPPPSDERLVAGIGDDAAVWRTGDAWTIATTDTLVAGVHFLPKRARWRDVGWKALAVNVSDIVAMGGTPSFALVTLCLPARTPLEAIDELYEGLAECAREYGVTVAGGDIVRSREVTVTVAVAGEASAGADGRPRLLRRGAAQTGDAVAVTGVLGGSAGGLRALSEGISTLVLAAGGIHAPTAQAARRLVDRHMRPQPRAQAGRAAIEAGVRCGIDVSDGLARDLGHICEESALGAELWLARLPIDPALHELFPDDATAMAATGGEDYELVLVAPEEIIDRVREAISVPITIVGRMVAGDHRVRVLDAGGAEVRLDAEGWDHFAVRRAGAC